MAHRTAGTGETDTDLLVAAILHDTVEDTEATIEEVCEHFGERVAALVAEVTHDEGLDSAERKRLEVERIASRSHPAKLIKLADKISNVRDFTENPPKWDAPRMAAYREFAAAFWTRCSGLNDHLDRITAEMRVSG